RQRAGRRGRGHGLALPARRSLAGDRPDARRRRRARARRGATRGTLLMPSRCALALLIVAIAVAMAVPRLAAAKVELPGLTHLGDDDGGQVAIDAEHIEFDQKANVVTATGAVKITRGDMVLTADTVKVNRTTQVAEAHGNVVVVDPQGTISADALTLNLVE